MSTVGISALTRRSKHSRYRLAIAANCYDWLDPDSFFYPHLGDLQTEFAPETTGLSFGSWDTLLVNDELWVAWTSVEADNSAFGTDNYTFGPWVAKSDATVSSFTLVGDQLEPSFTWKDGEFADSHLVSPPGLTTWADDTPTVRRAPILCTDGTDVFCVYELIIRVTDQSNPLGPKIPNTVYRCRRWTGATWELYGEINPQNGGDNGVVNVDTAYMNTPGASINTMPNQCVADSGNVYAVFSEKVRDGISGVTPHRRTRMVTFDGTAPPTPGEGNGYASFTDILTTDKVIVFTHTAIPPTFAPWYAVMLNSTGPVVYYVQYDVSDTTTEEQIRVWSLAGGALGTIQSADFNDCATSDMNSGPRLSTTAVLNDSSVEERYLATSTVGCGAVVMLVEVENPTTAHHIDVYSVLDDTDAGHRPYGLIAETDNLWVPGNTGSGELIQQFTDHQCPLPFWTTPHNGNIAVNSAGSKQGNELDESLWFGEWPTLGSGAGQQTYFTLREFPIHRCRFDCPTCESFLSQSPFETGDPPYNPPGNEDWSADAAYGLLVADRVEFYIDGVLVSTATNPSGDTFYYGDTAPGTIDLSTLTNALHTMTVVAYWDLLGVTCTDNEIIRVGPAPTNWSTVTIRVDGNVEETDPITGITEIKGILVGSAFCGSPQSDRLIDYVTIGSTGYGSSDIFSADFASTIVPPFDSTTNPGDLSIVGGALQVQNNPCADAYARKTFSGVTPANYSDIYIQIRVRINQPEYDDSVNNSASGADVLDVLDQNNDPTAPFDGIFDAPWLGNWNTYWGATSVGTISPDTYYVIDLHYSV